MRSLRGLCAATAFLLALPVALLSQALFGIDAEAVFHLMCAGGFVLLALAVLDFATPRWSAWTGGLAACALAVIFLLQGVSNLVPNDSLHSLAFDVLGQQPERVLPDLLLVWFVSLLLADSWGKTRRLGWSVMVLVVGVELAAYGFSLVGGSLYEAAPVLKLVLLLPFVWLAFESAKQVAQDTGKTTLLRPSIAGAPMVPGVLATAGPPASA